MVDLHFGFPRESASVYIEAKGGTWVDGHPIGVQLRDQSICNATAFAVHGDDRHSRGFKRNGWGRWELYNHTRSAACALKKQEEKWGESPVERAQVSPIDAASR